MSRRTELETEGSSTLAADNGPDESDELEEAEETTQPAEREKLPVEFLLDIEDRQNAQAKADQRTAQQLPLASWKPERFSAQTRDPQPTDRFKIRAYFGDLADLVKLQREAGSKEPEITTRQTLAVAKIRVAAAVKTRHLEPLDEGNPEQPGVSAAEIVAQFQTLHLSDPGRKMQAGLKLISSWHLHPLAAMTDGTPPDLFRQSIAQSLEPSPATLLPILQALDSTDREVRDIALELLGDPAKFVGKKAHAAAGLLSSMAFSPALDEETRLICFDILQATAPPLSQEMFVAGLLCIGDPNEDFAVKRQAAQTLYSAAFAVKED